MDTLFSKANIFFLFYKYLIYSSGSLQMSHTGPLIRSHYCVPALQSLQRPLSAAGWTSPLPAAAPGTKCTSAGLSSTALSTHRKCWLLHLMFCIFWPPVLLSVFLSVCVGVFGTCREARFLSSLLWSRQRQLCVNPPLQRSDHVALGVLQQFVQLRRRRWFSQSVNTQESNMASITTWKVFTSTSEAPGGGWRDWRPEIKTSYSRSFPIRRARALMLG